MYWLFALYSVCFTDASTGWAVGQGGTILHTTDGGTSWTAQTSGTTNWLHGVSFTDANTGTAVGDWGTILHTTTGGTGIEPPPSPTLASPPDNATVSTSPLLTWNPSEGALWYTLQVSRSPYFITYTLNRTNITETSYQLTGLQADTTFYWRVSMFDGTGTSRYSETWSFSTGGMAGPPPVSVAAAVSPTSGDGIFDYTIDLTNNTDSSQVTDIWTEVTGPDGFRKAMQLMEGKNLAANESRSETRTRQLAEDVPLGEYTIVAYVGTYPGIVMDSSGATYTKTALGKGSFSEGNAIPDLFELSENYPNPFNPSTTIEYALPRSSHVVLEVFNVLGEKVSLLINGEQDAGYHSVVFEAEGFPSGIYFYRLQARPLVHALSGGQAGSFVETKKLILMK